MGALNYINTTGRTYINISLQVPLLCLFRKAKTIISLFGVLCVVFVVLAATPAAFPYVEKDAPQRFYAVVG